MIAAQSLLKILDAAGYDKDQPHPACYNGFSYLKFIELLPAGKAPQSPNVRPEDIRAEVGVIVFAESERQMVADAIELADEHAWLLIESVCRSVREGDVFWRNIVSARPSVNDGAVHALRYLGARQLLQHHPDDANLVRLVEVPG